MVWDDRFSDFARGGSGDFAGDDDIGDGEGPTDILEDNFDSLSDEVGAVDEFDVVAVVGPADGFEVAFFAG